MTTISEVYDQINAFRHDPAAYDPACGWGSLRLNDLVVEPALERAAKWQAEHQCESVSHKTCPEWCHLFGGKCDHITRIKSFTFPNETWNENELLVKGPKRPFKHLIHSRGHCEHLLSNTVNSMGGAIVGNLFVLVLVWYKRP
jgi:uncharacterized protein YkwD